MGEIKIETQRLILRAWTEGDAEALYRYAKDPAVGLSTGWPPHSSVEHSLMIIREVLSVPESYAIILKETNEPIGSVGFIFGEGIHSRDRQDGDAEIGYWIGVPHWGQGLVPEAVQALLEYGFCKLQLRRIWAGYYHGNSQSRRVMEKCGFRPHHTEEGKHTLLGDTRTEHFMLLTKESYSRQS